MDTSPPLNLPREATASYKQHSKPKLPPFTRGENPTCPSPGPASPSATTAKPAAGSAQLHADPVSLSPPFSKSSAGETASGAARAGLPHLAPLLASTAASGAVQHGLTVVGAQRRQQQQRTKSLESTSTGLQLHSPTAAQQQQLQQRRANTAQATGLGAANSMSIETGVLSPRRVSLPSTTSSSPSPPPSSPQLRYRPGQLSPRSASASASTAAGSGASPSSCTDGADLAHSPLSPTAFPAATAFQYKSLSSAPSAGVGAAGDSGVHVLPVSPSRAVAQSSPHGHGQRIAHHHSASAVPPSGSGAGDGPAAGRNAELRPWAQSDVGIKKTSDAEQELQEQLAKLGASLNKLKSFSRSNSQNKSRTDLAKDHKTKSDRVSATRLANSDTVTAAPRAAPASRPRRLTRTASDSDSLRYDFDLRPCSGRSPLAVRETEAADDGDTFDTFPDDHKKLGTDSVSTRTRRELRNSGGKPPTARPKSLAASKGKGVQRSITFSHGNESAMRKHVYGNSGDDHHAIAALPPDLLLKRILFDKTSASPPPPSLTAGK